MAVLNSLALASKLTYALLTFIINSLVHTDLLKKVVLRESIGMWLKLDWPFSSTLTFLLIYGLTLSKLQPISSTSCPLHLLVVSHLLNFYMDTLHIMRIFIPLVVVFILAYVTICLTSLLPATFLVFLLVTVPLIKDFAILILPPLDYTSLVMLNLMKLIFLLSLALRPNPFPLFIFQFFGTKSFPCRITSSFPAHSSIQPFSV